MEPKKTALYDMHVALGAKMVDFAGYVMPIQYSGILQEHKRVRRSVGLFDVSHMGEFFVTGERALDYLQRLTTNNVATLSLNQAQYTLMCQEDGGIVDDLIVYRLPDRYMMVVNAANIQKDWTWAKKNLIEDVILNNRSDDFSLLALQGPRADDTLKALSDIELDAIGSFELAQGDVAGVETIVSRTGYTGERGFELCFLNEHSETVWTALMEAGKEYEIEPIGLAARDTLRLEMKFPLYGNDIDATTNPLEAGLKFATKLKKGPFVGRDAILEARERGIERKLVGFEMQGKAFPRKGYALMADGKEIGHVTSGTFSPMLEKSIGTGYVQKPYDAVGSEISVLIRSREVPAVVVKTPFYTPQS